VSIAAHTLRNRAFSLAELLVVALILVFLAVLTGTQLTTSSRNRQVAACSDNLQKIYIALTLYRADNGACPFVTGAEKSAEPLSLLVPKCTTETGMFICPASDDRPLSQSVRFSGRRISYCYYMGRPANDDPHDVLLSDWQVDTLPKKLGRPLFSSDGNRPGNNHGSSGGNLLLGGGAVEFSPPNANRDILFASPVTLLAP